MRHVTDSRTEETPSSSSEPLRHLSLVARIRLYLRRGRMPKQLDVRIKTDRLDAQLLAHYTLFEYLTPIWVPEATKEAMLDLVRLRLDVSECQIRNF